MKRKLLIVFLSIVCCFCLAFGVTACGGSNSGGITDNGEQTGSTDDGSSDNGSSTSDGDTTHTHTLAKTAAKDATCSKEGNIEYWYCSGCYKYFSDGNGTTEISLSDTVILKTEHTPAEAVKENDVAATCGSDGSYNSVVYCSVCGEKISSETIKVEATGKHTYNNSWTCTVCGYSEVSVSEGLAYTISDDKTYYTVSGIGECTDTDIVIPYTYNDVPVTAIAAYAFNGQTQLTSVYVPDSVTSIGRSAFHGCTSLTSITIPDSVSSIGSSAFQGCSNLTSVAIPDSVTSIGEYGFDFCTSLTNIIIADSVASIGRYAFRMCASLTSITIGSGVTYIGYNAFEGCVSIESINVSLGNTSYKSIDGNLYSYDGTNLIQYAVAKTDTSFTIPDSVTTIGDWAFYKCTSLTSVIV